MQVRVVDGEGLVDRFAKALTMSFWLSGRGQRVMACPTLETPRPMSRVSSTPNHLRARARRRHLSPSGSGRPLSRQELADAVNAYLWTTFRDSATVGAIYVGALELGTYRWPNPHRREAFRHVLQVRTGAEVGFFITRGWSGSPTKPVDGWDSSTSTTTSHRTADGDMHRRTALKPLALGAVAVAAPPALAGLVTVLTTYTKTTTA